jgi:hypothetical protein
MPRSRQHWPNMTSGLSGCNILCTIWSAPSEKSGGTKLKVSGWRHLPSRGAVDPRNLDRVAERADAQNLRSLADG